MRYSNTKLPITRMALALVGFLLATPVNASLVPTVMVDTQFNLDIRWEWTVEDSESSQPNPPKHWATGIMVTFVEVDDSDVVSGVWTIRTRFPVAFGGGKVRHVTDPHEDGIAEGADISISLTEFAGFLLSGTSTAMEIAMHGDHKDRWALEVTISEAIGDPHLIRLTSMHPVPIPAAVWLFGTALIGLAGFSKRRSRISA